MNREELAEMITAVYDRELQIDDVVMTLECEVHARQAAQLQVAELQERLNRADTERCAAVLAEREECAKVCDEAYYNHLGPEYGEVRYGIAACSAAIRARGKT